MSDLLVAYTQEFLETKDEARLRTILHKAFKITKGMSRLSKPELIATILDQKELVQDCIVSEDTIYKDSRGVEFLAKHQAESDEFDECVELKDVNGDVSYLSIEDFSQTLTKMRYSTFTIIDATTDVIGSSLLDRITAEQPIEAGATVEVVAKKTLKDGIHAKSCYDRIHKEIMQRFGYVSAEEDGYQQERTRIRVEVEKEYNRIYGFPSLKDAVKSFNPPQEPTSNKKQAKRSKGRVVNKNSKSQKVISIVTDFENQKITYTSGTVMKKLKELHNETIHRSFCITLMKRAVESLNKDKNG